MAQYIRHKTGQMLWFFHFFVSSWTFDGDIVKKLILGFPAVTTAFWCLLLTVSDFQRKYTNNHFVKDWNFFSNYPSILCSVPTCIMGTFKSVWLMKPLFFFLLPAPFEGVLNKTRTKLCETGLPFSNAKFSCVGEWTFQNAQ